MGQGRVRPEIMVVAKAMTMITRATKMCSWHSVISRPPMLFFALFHLQCANSHKWKKSFLSPEQDEIVLLKVIFASISVLK
jgi:hypothetical protein